MNKKNHKNKTPIKIYNPSPSFKCDARKLFSCKQKAQEAYRSRGK